jgi:hypothetical protein
MLMLALARPPAAIAHISTGDLSTTFRATVAGFRPAAPGLRAQVVGGDIRLRLTVPAGDRVVVLGLMGEPYLRFGPGGVWANGRSPTAATAGVVRPGSAAGWVRLSSGHSYTWHENRLRPVSAAPGGSTTRRVATWSVPMIVNGRRTVLTGAEWWGPRPDWWPWIAAGMAGLAAAAAAARFASRRALHVASLVLLAPVVAALGAGWIGIFLVDRVSPLGLALGAVGLAVTGVFVAVAVAAATGPARVCVAGLVGATAATFAIPQVSLFAHAFVLSALPGTPARLMMWIPLVGGTALAVICIPAAVELLDRSPYESLRPGHRLEP